MLTMKFRKFSSTDVYKLSYEGLRIISSLQFLTLICRFRLKFQTEKTTDVQNNKLKQVPYNYMDRMLYIRSINSVQQLTHRLTDFLTFACKLRMQLTTCFSHLFYLPIRGLSCRQNSEAAILLLTELYVTVNFTPIRHFLR